MTEVKYLDKTGLTSVWSKVKGIVTPKADKVSGATAGHLAGLNSSGNLTDSGLPASNIAQKDGSYSGMTVGAAEDLVSAESVASEFTSRITGGSTAVGKGGTALVDKIKGRTLVWNQQVQNGAATVQSGHKYYKRINGVASIATSDGASISAPNSGDMVIDLTLMFGAGNEPSTVDEFKALYPSPYYDYNPGTLISNAATAIETVGFNQWDEEWEVGAFNTSTGEKNTATNTIRSKNYIPVLPNTTYYASLSPKIASVYYYDSNKAFISFDYNSSGTRTTPANCYYIMFVGASSYGTTYLNDICINLSDPSRNGTYEPYWRSELELGLGDIKVKSHNLWDEEWEAGNINSTTGENAGSTTLIRSVNYIKVEPGKTYYAGTTGDFYYRFYDNNKNYIPFSSSFVQDANRARTVFTMPEGVGYIRFIHTGTTYTNDICLNLSDPAFNGRYEPYGDGGVISITGGLKSVFTDYDEISGGKFINRVGSVTLDGTTEVVAGAYTPDGSSVTRFGYAGAQNTSIYKAQTGYVSDKFMFAIGSSGDAYNVTNTNTTGANRLFIWLPSSVASTDAAANTWLASNPSTFYYSLAQPIEYELADALPTAMRNDPYGTERRLPEDTAAIVTAPFRADITYSTNIKEAVQSLPQNYINVNSMQDFLAALGTLMGGTWTMRPADGKFDFTFTPNPSNE